MFRPRPPGCVALITGTRDFDDPVYVHDFLRQVSIRLPIGCVVVGGDSPAEQYARTWAVQRGVCAWCFDHPAHTYDQRTRQMVATRPTAAIAFGLDYQSRERVFSATLCGAAMPQARPGTIHMPAVSGAARLSSTLVVPNR